MKVWGSVEEGGREEGWRKSGGRAKIRWREGGGRLDREMEGVREGGLREGRRWRTLPHVILFTYRSFLISNMFSNK
jgi:hypothetical protein